MEKFLKESTPARLGILQALGVVLYTVLVGSLMSRVGDNGLNVPDTVAAPFFLTLFVFSAGVTGSLVFGSAVYALTKGNLNRSISILAYTFGSLLAFLVIAILIIALTFPKS